MDGATEEPDYSVLWKDWILHSRESARQHGDETETQRWDGVLTQYLEHTGLEIYISPFTGREV